MLLILHFRDKGLHIFDDKPCSAESKKDFLLSNSNTSDCVLMSALPGNGDIDMAVTASIIGKIIHQTKGEFVFGYFYR